MSQASLNGLYLLKLFLAIAFLANSGRDAEVSRRLKIWKSSVLDLLITFLRHRRQFVVSLEPVILIRVGFMVYRSSIRARFALNVGVVVHRERYWPILSISTGVKDVI